jgi:translation initiation factor 2 subunit 2
MASEDPMSMFADMKKKKKKKAVVFNEDPVASEPDPSYPPKEPVHDPSLGPATAHEAAIEAGAGDVNVNNATEVAAAAEDDAKAMFGDLKKKKKKKELPVDGLVSQSVLRSVVWWADICACVG